MNAELITIIGASLIYLAAGIIFTRMLKACWHSFQQAADNNPALHLFTILAWWIVFAVLITWRLCEPLTISRRRDWE